MNDTTETAQAGTPVYQEVTAFVREHGDEEAKKFSDKPHRDVPHQRHLETLVKHISSIPDETFEASLSQEAKDWTTSAINAFNADTELPPPAGFAEAAEGTADKPKRKRQRAQKAEAAEAGNGSEAEKPKRQRKLAGQPRSPRTPKAGFTVRTLRGMVFQHPELSLDDMKKAAEQAGSELSEATIVLARQSARQMIALAEENGWQRPSA